jgi:molybdate transport system ATP-binding protein
MDEPLSALDRKTKSEILPFIEKLRDHFSLPIFYITHDMTEVERLADQVVLIDKGHVVASGPLAQLQSDPSLPLALSREAAVTLDGRVEAYDSEYGLVAVGVSGGRFLVPAPPAEIGERCRVRILAGDVSLAHEPLGLSSILNTEPSRIVSAKALETNEILAVLALGADGAGGRLLARVTRKSWDMLGLCEGANVYARVKAVSLRPGRGEFAGSGPSTPLSR